MCCVLLQYRHTALHLAVMHNSVDIVNLLLRKDSTLIKQTDKVSEQIM